jgi:hypothetical protein
VGAGGGCLQVAVRWWILMTGEVVWVSVLSEGGRGVLARCILGVGMKLLFYFCF